MHNSITLLYSSQAFFAICLATEAVFIKLMSNVTWTAKR